MEHALETTPRRRVLWLLFRHFFTIALFVVGGGYAIILAAEEIFVKKLRWLKDGELFEMLTIIQTVPGLTAGNAAIYVGYRSAGHLGALIALGAVALPSYLIICLISFGFGSIPMDNLYVQGGFIGIRTALTGLTLAAVIRMWPKAVRGKYDFLALLLAFLSILVLNWNPAIMLGAGIIGGIIREKLRRSRSRSAGANHQESGIAELLTMFFLFLVFGFLCIGGGSVLMPLYIQELVDARHWLTLQELSDVAAISQATPGPIGVNLATFLGFRQGGMLGALLCTVGLLLPSYLLMLAALSSLERWHQSLVVRGIIDGLAPVVVGLMAATMVIYLELSVFTEPIPWRYFGGKILGFAGDYPEGFRVCLGSLPIFIASVWLLYKGKCSIMTAIFSSAAFGAFFCR